MNFSVKIPADVTVVVLDAELGHGRDVAVLGELA